MSSGALEGHGAAVLREDAPRQCEPDADACVFMLRRRMNAMPDIEYPGLEMHRNADTLVAYGYDRVPPHNAERDIHDTASR